MKDDCANDSTLGRTQFKEARWWRHDSVDRGAGLVIKWLQNLGSTPDVVACHCVLEKDT